MSIDMQDGHKHLFINFSNHPSSTWDTKQLTEARTYGEIIDVSFPAVDPAADSKMIAKLAEQFANTILSCNPACVLCQGEFTLCYQVIEKLKREGIKVVAACSRRMVSEEGNIKHVEFCFEGFREY